MPIFQDDIGSGRNTPPEELEASPPLNSPLDRSQIVRKVSEESIRTDLCEGPLPDNPGNKEEDFATDLNTDLAFPILGTSDRVELIERLKRRQSATWLRNRNVSNFSLFCSMKITNLNTTAASRLRTEDISQAYSSTFEFVTTITACGNIGTYQIPSPRYRA